MTADELRARAARMNELSDGGEHAAARALWQAREEGEDPSARESLDLACAVATSKDPDLRVLPRLEAARALLAPHLAATGNPDLIGVAGAIERRFYEVDLRVEHLGAALALYRRGHELDAKQGWPALGYPGINAAFLMDQLGAFSGSGPSQEAEAIRRTLIRELPARVPQGEPGYFVLATVAEAHFGLRDYAATRPFLERAAATKVAGWRRETTGRQLAALARIQGGPAGVSPAAVEALGALFGGDANALCSAVIGKLGLALSGGGFRASLFHLGVLTRLAELDLLRHVEVLSCVSGGSILGALYYLELRRRLLAEGREPIDYVELVGAVRDRFFAGLRMDVRNRIFFSPVENWRMLGGERSRTEVAASLYERSLYAPAALDQSLKMRDLGAGDRRENYWRRNKRPLLILNAATLNTGHAWQFTTEEMGEPTPIASEDVDVNDRFERRPYAAFPLPACDVRLGTAVAASACVPGIFEPIELRGAYGKHVVRLVDGGVHDNQGVRALLDRDCTAIIVSDASGQMGFVGRASPDALGTVLRSDSIFQARIREAQYADLQSRRRGNLLRYLCFVHLKQDFKPRSIPPGEQGAADAAADETMLPYGISRAVQQRLALLRTDLDAFSEVECELLMASGYAMADTYVRAADIGAPPPESPRRAPALPGRLLARPGTAFREGGWAALLSHLDAGGSVMGKSLLASRGLRRGAQALGLAAAVAAGWWLWRHWGSPVTHVTAGALAVGLGALLLKRAVPVSAPLVDLARGNLPGLALLKRAVLALTMAVGARGASWLVQRTFLQGGRLERFMAQSKGSGS